ncbi:MAG TPA: hypothetical protein VLL54_00045 [Pyrinomonadaceae bacterium]|nr:hypothetical protein [Pyrinomonadaceae bacterium]
MDKQTTSILVFLLFLVFGVVLIGGLIVATIVHNRREKERTLQFENTAKFLGLTFAATAPLEWIPNVDRFALFSQGHSKTITNVLYGTIDGVKGALFDYQYVVGSGKNRTVHNQSVAYFEPKDLRLPLFSLRPESTLHKIISAFGYQDIDFGNRPEFSRQYLLRGADELAIRQTFNDRVLSFYEGNVGTCTEGGGNQLFVFRQNHRIAPAEAQSFLSWAGGVKNLFTGTW